MDTRAVQNKAAAISAATISPGMPATEGADKVKRTQKAKTDAASSDAQLPSVSGKGDVNVSISPQSKEISDSYKKALDLAKASPDVREAKVADIKKRIDAGTYQPDAGKIADGMLREAILDRLAKPE